MEVLVCADSHARGWVKWRCLHVSVLLSASAFSHKATINISCDIAVTTGFPWVCPAESKRMFSETLAHAIIPTVKPHRNSDSIRRNTCKISWCYCIRTLNQLLQRQKFNATDNAEVLPLKFPCRASGLMSSWKWKIEEELCLVAASFLKQLRWGLWVLWF